MNCADSLRHPEGKSAGCSDKDNLQLSLLASRLYAARARIDSIFGIDGLCRSPAWDIMLDLFRSESKGETVSIASATIGAGCSTATAMRWLQVLEDRGLIERKPDPRDRCSAFVNLTHSARTKIVEGLEAHSPAGSQQWRGHDEGVRYFY